MTYHAMRRGDGDRRVAGAPVVTVAREQPHRVALPPDLEAIAVVLDLVHPIGAGRRLGGARRDAGQDEPVGTGGAR
jgi:hypothetical protein